MEHICLKDLTLLCQDHVDLPKHSFKMGMKLEMVSPWEQLQICPVSVTKVSHTGAPWKHNALSHICIYIYIYIKLTPSPEHSPAAFLKAALDF